jgi:hypothetical protein
MNRYDILVDEKKRLQNISKKMNSLGRSVRKILKTVSDRLLLSVSYIGLLLAVFKSIWEYRGFLGWLLVVLFVPTVILVLTCSSSLQEADITDYEYVRNMSKYYAISLPDLMADGKLTEGEVSKVTRIVEKEQKLEARKKLEEEKKKLIKEMAGK